MSTAAPAVSTDFEPVEDVFFEDGNLILQSGRKLFRVYRGILASQSSVFRDMLAQPQPRKRRSDPIFMDGAAVIQMQDSPIELEYFLKALFHPQFFPPVPYRTSAAVLIGILRLSAKYDVRTLRTRALQHLATAFPTSLSSLSINESRDWTFDILNSSERVALTQVAHEVGALWALPIGLHKISFLLSFDELHDAAFTPPSVRNAKYGDEWYPPPSMEEEHRRACLKLYSLHSKHCFQLTSFLLLEAVAPDASPSSDTCDTPEICSLARYQWLTNIQRLVLMSEPRINPFYIWGDHFWSPYEVQMCDPCLEKDRMAYESEVQKLWEDLPRMLGLPDWDVLEKMKKEDLQERF